MFLDFPSNPALNDVYGLSGKVWRYNNAGWQLYKSDTPPVLRFLNRATVVLSTIGSDIDVLETLGYSTAGDGGGAIYDRVGSQPSHTGYVQSADGAYWVLRKTQVLTPEMWGATASIDNRLKFKAMATSINAFGGAVVRFLPHDYPVWTTGTVPIQDLLFGLSNLSYFDCDMKGARITTPATTWTDFSYIFGFDTCDDVHVHSPEFNQTAHQTTDFTMGTHLCYFRGECNSVHVTDIYQVGGVSGVFCVRANDPTLRASNITITGVFHNVFYPANFRRSGDDAEVRIETHDAGRSLFPYNIRNLEAWVDSNGSSEGNDCLLKVYADNTENTFANILENINLNYTAQGQASVNYQPVYLQLQQLNATTSNAIVRNIKIKVTINLAQQPQIQTMVFIGGKVDHLGAPDTTIRNYLLGGIDVSGSVVANGQPLTFLGAFNTADDWSGEGILDFYVHDINSTNVDTVPAIDIDADGITGPLVLERIFADTDVLVSNLASNVLKVAAIKAANVTTSDFEAAGNYP